MTVEETKRKYPKGTRIRLLHMDDIQAPPDGTEGTVIGVDDIGDILMRWDTGSGLNLVPGEDKYEMVERICPRCRNGYRGYPAISREDNLTEICPACGVREAIEDFLNNK